MTRRIKGAGRKNGLVRNLQNRVISRSDKYAGYKQTKRPVHRNGNVPPEFQ